MAFEMLMVAILSLIIFHPSTTRVAAQGAAPAPSPAVYKNNITMDPVEWTALKDMVAEWKKTNSDLNGILQGWSDETQPFTNLEANVWQGLVYSSSITNTTNDGGGIYTQQILINVIGMSITDTDLVGILPPAIGNLSNLAFVYITGNQGLNGPIPKELSQLKQLQILDLHNNNFTGTIPMELGMMEKMVTMDFSKNNLTGSIPSSLCYLPYLTILQLSRNQLSGSIPGSNKTDGLGFGNSTRLAALNLMENQLTGGLPDFRSLPELQYLNLSHNKLSGPVVLDAHFNTSAQQPLQNLDLSSNAFTGPIPNLTKLSSTLQQLYLSNNPFDTPTVPQWLSNFTALRNLGLANINLAGTVPNFLFTLPNLQYLELQRNSFGGELDMYTFTTKTSPLEWVNLTNNNIASVGYSDPTLLNNQNIHFLLEGNPFCNNMEYQNMTPAKYFFCRNPMTPDTVLSSTDHYQKVIISTSVTISGFFLLIVVGAIAFYWRSRHEKHLYYLQIQEEFAKKHVQPTLYAYHELRSATREFHPDMKLGQGGFGIVYKGVQADGTELAVKDLVGRTQQGLDEFLNEVVLITGMRHRNLVKLKGCCLKDDRRLLVYEFVENNNLAEVLFEGVGNHDLNWSVRYNMCMGVAEGLHYLHEFSQPRIIHRDVKAPNILLDKNLNPKIADFGLARLFPDEESHISTLHIAGTMGYMAPEYASRGQLTEKADVFSFGVVMLEIVSGRKNIEPKLPIENVYLIELAWRLHENGMLLRIVDTTMNIRGYEEEVERVLNIALICVQSMGHSRPSMARVVSMLKGEIEPELISRESQLNKLEYDSFLATAQSTGTNDFTITAIAERDEHGDSRGDYDKPLLILPVKAPASNYTPSISNPRLSHSGRVELSTIRPR